MLLCDVKPVECAGVEKKDVAFAHIKTSFRNNSVQVTGTNIGAWFGMRDINASGLTIEKVKGHFVNRRSFRSRIQVAQGINMGRAMVAHQKSPGLVGESAFEVLDRFLMQMVFPDHGLEVPWVDMHSLIDLLGKVDHSGHRFAS